MAIAGMNGQWLGGRSLRTNWATGKGGGTTQRTQTSELIDSASDGPSGNFVPLAGSLFFGHEGSFNRY